MRVFLATSLILALGAGTAHGAPFVVVHPHGKEKQRVDLADHAGEGKVNENYTVKSRQGRETVEVVNGFSVNQVLRFAHLRTVEQFVRITDTDRNADVLLDRPNLRSEPYGGLDPVIFIDGNGRVVFLRPQREVDDENAPDFFKVQSGNLEIIEYDRPLVNLTIEASDTEVDPGDAVSLTADLRQPSGFAMEEDIDWTATGREAKTGEEVNYKFPDAARAVVTAQLSDEDGVVVADDDVEILVGDPEESNQNQIGGGFNNNTYAPDYGSYYGDTGAATPSYPDNSNQSVIPDTPADKLALPAETGEEISGELLSETGVYVPPPPEELLGVRSGTPDEGTNWTMPGIALGATLVVGLLGFGAGREFERLDVRRLRNLLPV